MPDSIIIPAVNVVREGHTEPFLGGHPAGSSSAGQWGGIALKKYKLPAVFAPRHEHPEHFLSLVLRGNVRYEINTKGRNFRFISRPGTITLLPRGTVDQHHWAGPTERLVVAIHPRLLTNALEETAHRADVELTERWDLIDQHISALLHEMAADLDGGSPAGPIYGESLANTLGVYLLKRYAVQPLAPVGTGRTPHTYVLHQRIERAKQRLRHPACSIADVGLDAGFENPSHFARVFRRLVGTTPSRFRAE